MSEFMDHTNGMRLPRRWIKVLMYHGIYRDEDPGAGNPYNVRFDDFRRQLDLLDRWGFVAITFNDYRQAVHGLLDLPKKPVVITFDDGYRNIYDAAYPALKEHGMRAVLFTLGEQKIRMNYWDRRLGMPEIPLLEGHQIVEMHMSGFEIGAHSLTHADLTAVSQEHCWVEISRSRMLLEILLNAEVLSFSYPYGRTNRQIKNMVASAGYDLACAGEGGPPVFGADLYEIKRIKIADGCSALNFALRMLLPFEYLTYVYSQASHWIGRNKQSGGEPWKRSPKSVREIESMYSDIEL